MFKKIWKDPVWSKVIAGVILYILAFLYALIKSMFGTMSFHTALKGVFEAKISVLYVLTLIIVVLIIIAIFRKKDSQYTPKQRKFLRQNTSKDDTTIGYRYKWTPYFDSVSGNPKIDGLTILCTKHNPPTKLMSYKCPERDCPNSKLTIDIYKTENQIESMLIDLWDRENK